MRALSGEHRLEHNAPELDDVELTSPPLAPEVLAELERLGAEKQVALDRHVFAVAAAIRDASAAFASPRPDSSASGSGFGPMPGRRPPVVASLALDDSMRL